MTVRVVVIGTGFGRRVVAPVFDATPGCAVVGVVSARDADAIDTLLHAERPDLVSIQSPPFLHRRHVEAVLRHGVGSILCDKPFGIDAAESHTMYDDAESAGVVHLVNFEFRAEPMRERLRDLVQSGALGTVEHVGWTHWSSGSRVPMRAWGWLFDRARGGGWIGAWASHAVDTVRFVLGDEFDVLSALPRTVVRERADADGATHVCTADDTITAVLRGRRSEATVTIDSTFAATASVAPRIVVQGSLGVAELTADRRLALRWADGTREESDAPPVPSGTDPHQVAMTRWAERVRDSVSAGAAVASAATFADGLAVAKVLDQLRAGVPTH